MRTEYKHNPPIPYSLHDMRVKKIIIQDKTIFCISFKMFKTIPTRKTESVWNGTTLQRVEQNKLLNI